MQQWTLGTVEDIDGTSLVGYVDVTLAQLEEAFGPSTFVGDEWKVDREWSIIWPDGERATIYNYKDGEAYTGGRYRVADVTCWHIGGTSTAVIERVGKLLGRPARNWLDEL